MFELAIIWSMLLGGPAAAQSARPEHPLLLVCRFGEPGEAGGKKEHSFVLLYRPKADGAYAIEVRDESGVLGGGDLKLISSIGDQSRSEFVISASDGPPVGSLLTVQSLSPRVEQGGLELLSASFGVMPGIPRAGTCGAIKGEHAVRLFDKKEPAQ